ncbi:MAG: NAD-dependent epimerase/dehydratase family protein [Nibricoccus sp.]
MTPLAPGFFKGKHLVIFGAGYVGGACAAAMGGLGARVTCLTRNPAKVASLASEGCDVVIDELSTDAWHSKIKGSVDFVLNCVSSGGGGIESYRKSYVEGTRSILAWTAKRGGVGTFVYTSSTSVYPQSGGVRVDETAEIAATVGTPAVLLEAENLVRAAPAQACRRWFILRLAGIYGPRRHHLLDQLRAGETVLGGTGAHRLNLIHRDDIVSAIMAAFAAPEGVANETFNVADDGAAPKAELAAWLAAKLSLPTPTFSGEPTPGRRAVTSDRIIANDKIKGVLGWQPKYPNFRAGYQPLLEA